MASHSFSWVDDNLTLFGGPALQVFPFSSSPSPPSSSHCHSLCNYDYYSRLELPDHPAPQNTLSCYPGYSVSPVGTHHTLLLSVDLIPTTYYILPDTPKYPGGPQQQQCIVRGYRAAPQSALSQAGQTPSPSPLHPSGHLQRPATKIRR